MAKYVEVTVDVVVATLKNGKDKIVKEVYLVDASSITEAEARVVKHFKFAGFAYDYTVSSAKQSRIIRVIE